MSDDSGNAKTGQVAPSQSRKYLWNLLRILSYVAAIAFGAVLKGDEFGSVTAPIVRGIAHEIADESIVIELIVDPPRVRQGETVQVIPFLTPGNLPTYSGTLDVSCGTEGVLERIGHGHLVVVSATEPTQLEAVVCRAVRPGVAHVRGQTTIANANVHDREVEVIAATEDSRPSRGNLGGKWSVVLGAEAGSMRLQHVDSEVSGSFKLNEGARTGAVHGIADGGVFTVTFIDSKRQDRFQIDAKVGEGAGMLEITGDAERLQAKHGGWAPMPKTRRRFRATAGGPGSPLR